ncbi:MMPL family transporter [Gordonia desulfuricans]|uniref:MMPL family transporter n=2 Tax=Gordonia desulfuricans TaxID=89051 RepID=A0A7K3LL67_9ACTN|nr:MMPL family transporter [Gordonia desulfuricans]
MFGAIGTFVYRMRFAVIAVMVVLMAGLGLYGMDLNKYLSQSGWFDPTSESSKGAVVADRSFGRDHTSDVILLVTPPEGTTVDNPEFGAKVETFVNDLIAAHPDIVNRNDPGVVDPFDTSDTSASGQAALDIKRSRLFTEDKQHAFISIGVTGNDDTTVLNNYKTIEPFFDNIPERFDIPGATFQLAGLQPVAGAMASGMDDDIRRAEIIALPLVALMLFFIFGGVVAACLPVLIGGLTIAGSLGMMKILAQAIEVNIFAQSVVTLIGLGIAIDYGLFIVSRFREELAEGYTTRAAVRRTVMTSGQTVVFSATIIVAALACLLIMPQGFLKSVAYGAIFSVSLAAILSITVLPAILGILGPRIDAMSLRWMLSFTLFPIVRKFSPAKAESLEHKVADLTGRTKSREQIEHGFWGRLSGWVMQHPVATAVPTVLILLLLTVPFGGIKFGGISEQYLPPNNSSRIAQENFDSYFPTERTEAIKIVIAYNPDDTAANAKIAEIAEEASKVPGFTKPFSISADDAGAKFGTYGDNGPAVVQMSAGLVDRTTAAAAIKDLRAINHDGVSMWVTGTPTLTQDSIDALLKRLPLMAVMLVLITGLLMFLAFGSVVLPIKAALMSALGLAATLGILTWIFVDGHGATLANFTPGPLFAAVLVLIIAIVFGLSTDYEIFLLARMVEARQKGASTTEAIRMGTAYTGRLITAAAAILVVVTGAFGFSEIVMMKYIAYGMIAALILDATIIRMLLVPSVMKLLGDDCWWAPRWMQTLQRKIGLGETVLDDEPEDMVAAPAGAAGRAISAGTLVSEVPTTAMRAARPVGVSVRKEPQPAAPASAPAPTRSAPAAQPASTAGPADPTREHARPYATDPDRSRTSEADRSRATPARVGPSAPPTARRQAPRPPMPPSASAPPMPADQRPMPPRRYSPRNVDRPDTGSWRLGEGGIRLGVEATGDVDPRPARRATGNPVSGPRPAITPDALTPPAATTPPASTAPRPPATGRPARPQPRPSTPPARRTGPAPRPNPAPAQQDSGANGVPSVPQNPAGPAGTGRSPLSRRPELDQTGRRPLAASLSPEDRSPSAPGRTAGGPSPMDRGLSQGLTPSAPNRPGATTDSGATDPDTPSDASASRSTGADRHARDNADGDKISVQDLLRRSRSGDQDQN